MKAKQMCGCGCESEALFWCRGFDFDPRVEGGRGEAFAAPSCRSFAAYLAEASAELEFPFTMERIVNVPD
jgi:hypothetical protein